MIISSSLEGADHPGAGSACPAAVPGSPDDEGLMVGVLTALRSSSLSTDEQQRRLNTMIVELQQLRRNLETSTASPASVLSPTHRHRNSPVCLPTPKTAKTIIHGQTYRHDKCYYYFYYFYYLFTTNGSNNKIHNKNDLTKKRNKGKNKKCHVLV